MANLIKCPACGENNLSDQEFCQYCQARLQPLTGKLKGADAPLQPGQFPTKKDTGELEPMLPQWLREARNSARQISQEDTPQTAQQSQGYRPESSGGDLLAGLQSQTQDDDEEDTPDWLANITGEAPKTKKNQAESSEVRWVELGAANDFAQPEPESDTPTWLKGISPLTLQSGEKDELTDWLQDSGGSQKSQQSSQPISFDRPVSVSSDAGTPDWLHSMSADNTFNDPGNVFDEPFVSSDTPDWLRAMGAENDAQNATPPSFSADVSPVSSDTPDWLRAMGAENEAQNTAPPSFSADVSPVSSDTPDWLRTMGAENDMPSFDANITPISSDTPDWLSAMGGQEKTQSADSEGFSETGMGESDSMFSSVGDTPDWLKGLESSTPSSDKDWLPSVESEKPAQDSAPVRLSAAPTFIPEQEQASETPEKEDVADLPAWLKSTTPAPVPEQGQTPVATEKDSDALDIPSWLKASAPQSSIFDEPPVGQEMPGSEASSADSLDWLNAFKSVDLPDASEVPAFSMDAPVDSIPSASTKDAQPSAQEDALFTDMPAWLSIVDETVPPESIPAPITNTDAIAPGDLPSWVQAMRPVDAGVPQPSSTSLSSDKKLESSGALAGLQGVLPAVQGFAPTSKPKAYSIKMKASEEQQAHAALLEQILAAETSPVPIGSFSVLGTSRVLRWVLTLIFFAGLTIVLFMQTRIFSMPVGWPVEVDSALQTVRAIPGGAPVLVIFDYEPARVGEIESVAVPMFDQMQDPRLTFVSTNETGAILAERFVSQHYSGIQYLNLGYLPGGQMGVRAFVENPVMTAPYALTQSPALFNISLLSAWDLSPLLGVTSFSQFAALILITDNADSARAWIEQTTSAPDPTPAIPLVVVSSAQAAPMIQPYYASQQINGLVSGLYGGALFEQSNSGRPGTARAYWDAYNIGMLLATALILGGALLSLALGLRDRAAAREAK